MTSNRNWLDLKIPGIVIYLTLTPPLLVKDLGNSETTVVIKDVTVDSIP